MVQLYELWVPILLSSVIVFVASSLLHMVLKYHSSDYRKLPDENAVVEVLRRHEFKPGSYFFPHMTDMKQMKEPAMIEKFTKGPVGFITFRPSGPPAMGKSLVQWFLYCILIGVFVAYLAGRTLPHGVHYMTVFRFAGTVAFMGYGLGNIMDSIWKGQTWGSTAKHLVDGLIYGLLTAGTFGWLWPR